MRGGEAAPLQRDEGCYGKAATGVGAPRLDLEPLPSAPSWPEPQQYV